MASGEYRFEVGLGHRVQWTDPTERSITANRDSSARRRGRLLGVLGHLALRQAVMRP